MVIETLDERTHLITRRTYDEETLDLVSSMVTAAPGWQLNGHRADCRCVTCRPDIVRLPCASG